LLGEKGKGGKCLRDVHHDEDIPFFAGFSTSTFAAACLAIVQKTTCEVKKGFNTNSTTYVVPVL
jgi:hypothetical protein